MEQQQDDSGLPDWAEAAMVEERLSQPWKKYFAADNDDDPNFAQEKETIRSYDRSRRVCHGEGSMAA
jgi:hypothetical protein